MPWSSQRCLLRGLLDQFVDSPSAQKWPVWFAILDDGDFPSCRRADDRRWPCRWRFVAFRSARTMFVKKYNLSPRGQPIFLFNTPVFVHLFHADPKSIEREQSEAYWQYQVSCCAASTSKVCVHACWEAFSYWGKWTIDWVEKPFLASMGRQKYCFGYFEIHPGIIPVMGHENRPSRICIILTYLKTFRNKKIAGEANNWLIL